ncbi:MAG: thioredoxin family protein [Endomicrobiaceae bacterium]|nr:thioredoxin family protein [Endomicrobiaceae bacterium]MDD3923383.1 thioredoxin family protein [Endomicrobiaceae bacterium]
MLKKTSLLLIAGIVFIGLSIGITAEKNTIQKNISKQEQKTVSDKKDIKVTFVELGSVNCIPCKMMQPVMADIEKEYGTQVKVIFYDVWTKEGQPYSEKYKILVIPTQVFLDKDGKEFFRHQGFFPKEDIVKVLEKGGVKI